MEDKQISLTSKQREPRHFLTVPEVAELLRLKPRTVYDMVSQRRIPFRKAGDRTIFSLEEVLNWTALTAQGQSKKQPALHFDSEGSPRCGVRSAYAQLTDLEEEVTCKRCLKGLSRRSDYKHQQE